MSYIKVYSPEVANLVGVQAASLLSHIKYWCESSNVTKIYRTNKQLSNDFQGALSESQIQRCKKKLLDNGLIEISHDLGHTRTTHYKLTDKAKTLLGMVVEKVKKTLNKVKQSVNKAIKKDNHKPVVGFSLKEALKQAKKPVEPELEVTYDNEEVDQDYDEHFKALDIAMESCLKKKEVSTFSLSDLMSQAFNKIPNIDLLENKRKMLDDAIKFTEDY